ncbi:uncharacterized protein SCODWIG_00132 [Saccharomycodes ludwigii]|uniref:ER membrane protein complex subunit 10 n=1 Tax=Saccharomycodes ludwigii TaxID=36035 RepID=A0A376B159_9ASCO|nr:uncharacterized protein SCODWIG_00132 [Saccharomycodes ludwigii]
MFFIKPVVSLFLCTLLIGLVHSKEQLFPIYAIDIQTNEKYPFFTASIDDTTLETCIKDINTNIPENLYCVSVEHQSCFSLVKLHSANNSYSLEINPDENGNYKFSLKRDPSIAQYKDGISIVPIIQASINGSTPEVTKLKKVTKQYPKKSSKNNDRGSASFKEDVNDDSIDEKEMSFIQKNWRLVVLGLLIYFFVSRNAGENNDGSKEENK